MKIISSDSTRKDPLSPIIRRNNKIMDIKSSSKSKNNSEIRNISLSSSFVTSFLNNSDNKYSFQNKQVSPFNELLNVNKNKNISYNNMNVNNSVAKSENTTTSQTVLKKDNNLKEKNVKFLDDENLINIIEVESYKKYLKIEIEDNLDKDVDKIKSRLKKNTPINTFKNNNSNLKDNKTIGTKNDSNDKKNQIDQKNKIEGQLKMVAVKKVDNNKKLKNNQHNQNSDKACVCLIY